MNRKEEIEIIAYHMWDMEGRPEGKSLEYWLMAESIWEINHRAAERGKGTEAKSQPDAGKEETGVRGVGPSPLIRPSEATAK